MIADAVAAAVAGDTISVFDSVHTEANIAVSKDVTIEGQGAANTTVQANVAPGTGVGQVFVVDAGVTATIRDMTVRYGSNALGAGIFNSGTLNVNNATISDNAAGSNPGGGIFNAGVLFLTDSTVSNNSAKYGGGIASGGAVTVRNSTLSGNSADNSGPLVAVAYTVVALAPRSR